MTITLVGVVTLPLCAALFLLRPTLLAPALAASVPFSATALVNINAVHLGVQAYHVLGALLLVRWALWPSGNGSSFRRPGGDLPAAWLGLFTVAVLASLYAPLLKGQLDLFNITQTGYLLFGIAVSFVLSRAAADPETLRHCAAWFLWSHVFVALWALFQFACFTTEVPYPDWIFNNSASTSATLFDQVIDEARMPRVSSVTVEPSVLARQLLSSLAIALCFLQPNSPLSRLPLRLFTTIYVAVLILCTSSTAYFGIVLISLYALARLPWLALAAIPVGMVAATLIVIFLPNLADAVYIMTIGKTSGGSFAERFASVQDGMAGFAEAPWTGQGWGSVNSWDLAFKLLSNTGVLGTFTFFAFTVSLLATGAVAIRLRPLHLAGHPIFAEAFAAATIVALSVDAVAGFTFVMGNIWLLLGALWAAGTLYLAEHPTAKEAL